MTTSIWDDYRLLGLAHVLQPTYEYEIRRIQRWYSRQFYTPLPTVLQLPLDHLLEHYFECRYEDLEPEEREALRLELLQTPVEAFRAEMEAASVEAGDAEFAANAEKILADLKAKQDAKPLPVSDVPAISQPQKVRGRSSWEPELDMGAARLPRLNVDFGELTSPSFQAVDDDESIPTETGPKLPRVPRVRSDE